MNPETIVNISYGNDPAQRMDVYLPASTNSDTKVFILIHGGGWSGGSKAEFNYAIPILRSHFPDHAIVNMNYRLATIESPAFPKQVEDIEKVIAFLTNSNYNLSDQFALIGASAGAHIALLYSYKYDTEKNIKAVCSIVGPTDFTDPSYTENPLFHYAYSYLLGNVSYEQHPELFIEASPITHVSEQSPPTILFYAGKDMLVPTSQAQRLKQKLASFGVDHEYNLYQTAAHGNWNSVTMFDFQSKLIAFFKERF